MSVLPDRCLIDENKSAASGEAAVVKPGDGGDRWSTPALKWDFRVLAYKLAHLAYKCNKTVFRLDIDDYQAKLGY